jgi:hypothetical protein
LRTARTAEVGARPDFDLDFHMRRVTAPSPGTVETVLEMAQDRRDMPRSYCGAG